MRAATTVIIAFYNKTDYLSLVLAGLKRQSVKDFKVIIADDGSSPAAVAELEVLLGQCPFPTLHLWQKDAGFRKNRMLNKAIMAAADGQIVFIDGDCVPHKEFIRGHIEYSRKGVCLTGRRVNLSEKFTALLTPAMVASGYLERNFLRMAADGIFGASVDVEKGIFTRSSRLRAWFNAKPRGVLGCNFSAQKADLLAVNGFDERYIAPSVGEDSDIEYRLRLAGVTVQSLNHIAVQYHLYHRLQPRPQENLLLFEQVKKDNLAVTPFGIRQSGQAGY